MRHNQTRSKSPDEGKNTVDIRDLLLENVLLVSYSRMVGKSEVIQR
jgi:hypothetical protein